MAGMKGRSGGARPGSGPKKKTEDGISACVGDVDNAIPANETPLEFMLRVMNDPKQSVTVRSRMAITAAQYVHTKTGDGGKKDAKQAAADRAGFGKFAPAAPPKLIVNNR